jgi:ribonuclease R
VGHFALASDHYAHFTSPIRRYPDLLLHRRLQQFLDGELTPRKRQPSEGPSDEGEGLNELGRRMSYLSRRAEHAERELVNLKVLTLLAKQVGDTFDGVVTGVTGFGLFVQHPTYLVEGLLRIEDLGDDWFEIDDRKAQVVGERTRARFRLGTEVNVRIVNVELGSRQLHLSLVSAEGARGGKRSKRRGTASTEESAPRSSRRSGRGPPRAPSRHEGSGRGRRKRKP